MKTIDIILLVLVFSNSISMQQSQSSKGTRFSTGNAAIDYGVGELLGSLIGRGTVGGGCSQGRRMAQRQIRQATEGGKRFFGLDTFLVGQNTCCYCDYSLTFSDKFGVTHGACQTSDSSGRLWCYTAAQDSGCADAQQSGRFPANPWSYQACGGQGRK